jgi:hypothetical protein
LATDLPKKVIGQIRKAGLPTEGQYPFKPKLIKNRKGHLIIKKGTIPWAEERKKRIR